MAIRKNGSVAKHFLGPGHLPPMPRSAAIEQQMNRFRPYCSTALIQSRERIQRQPPKRQFGTEKV